jgi:hypothetical protein
MKTLFWPSSANSNGFYCELSNDVLHDTDSSFKVGGFSDEDMT